MEVLLTHTVHSATHEHSMAEHVSMEAAVRAYLIWMEKQPLQPPEVFVPDYQRLTAPSLFENIWYQSVPVWRPFANDIDCFTLRSILRGHNLCNWRNCELISSSLVLFDSKLPLETTWLSRSRGCTSAITKYIFPSRNLLYCSSYQLHGIDMTLKLLHLSYTKLR